jgi:uncharacterized protein
MLLLIGLVHAFFIWYGDILVFYVLSGLLLPLFFSRKPRTILIWTTILFSILLLLLTLGTIVEIINKATPTELAGKLPIDVKNRVESSFYAYGQGSFAAIMAQRVSDTLFMYGQLLVSPLLILPLFLLGVYAGKKGFFQNIEAKQTFIKKAWMWGLIIGLPMSVLKYLNFIHYLPHYDAIHRGAGIFGDTGLGIFYMTSIVLLFRNEKWISRLKPFGYVGRMALSNYLFQSIICTMIFYNYGLGLYGQIAPAFGLIFVVVIFTIQIFISKYWLECYQFGPMEWLWKSLTYGKRFKMKK